MKRGPQQNLDKKLSIKNMLKKISKCFDIPEPKKEEKRGKPQGINLRDCLLAAFAMFSLKFPSLLSFDDASDEDLVSHNIKKLYLVENIPSDTYLRERLDVIDPQLLRVGFTELFSDFQRDKGFEKYKFLNGYIVVVDGSQIFESNKISCTGCCKKEHRDGKVSYYHQILAGSIVHPDLKQVIPLCPEPIVKQDGTIKNDCESNAMRRFLMHLKKEHPKMKFTITADALYANAPIINLIIELGFDFIVNAKPSANPSLFSFMKGLTLREVKTKKGKNTYTFRYINKVPLNDTKNTPEVNFIECVAEEVDGKRIVTKTFSWVTSHEITDDNVYEIMRGGRARWKIENETFNTLKTQGYQFEHNFGHGKKNLHTVFAMIMMLAFLVDQIQEASCGLFQAAVKKSKRKIRHWERMRSFFFHFYIDSWDDFYQTMAFGQKNGGPRLTDFIANTS